MATLVVVVAWMIVKLTMISLLRHRDVGHKSSLHESACVLQSVAAGTIAELTLHPCVQAPQSCILRRRLARLTWIRDR